MGKKFERVPAYEEARPVPPYVLTWLPPVTQDTPFLSGERIRISFTVRNRDTGEFVHDETVELQVANAEGDIVLKATAKDLTVQINDEAQSYTVEWMTQKSVTGMFVINVFFRGISIGLTAVNLSEEPITT